MLSTFNDTGDWQVVRMGSTFNATVDITGRWGPCLVLSMLPLRSLAGGAHASYFQCYSTIEISGRWGACIVLVGGVHEWYFLFFLFLFYIFLYFFVFV